MAVAFPKSILGLFRWKRGGSDEEREQEPVLRPLLSTGPRFWLLGGVVVAMIVLAAYAWYVQLTNGLSVTGMRDWGVGGGAPWATYIATFIWWVGIAHGGIAVSAAIRLMKIEQYRPIARLAEVVTPVTLGLAGISIVLDVGRPDRVFNMVLNYQSRVTTSPLIWDLTVILVYFSFSTTYLVITMREDLARLRPRAPWPLKVVYRVLLLGYHRKERKKMERVAWWLALTLIVLMVLLSGGVIPWLFGLLATRPGWFGAVLGPYFLTAALASAVAAVIVVAAVARRAYRWERLVPDDLFRGLGKALAVLLVLYLWLMLHEQLTMRYAGPVVDREISDAMLFGPWAAYFWSVTAVFIAGVVYFAAQGIRPSLYRPWAAVLMSVLVLAAFWFKRLLIIVPPLTISSLPYPTGSYAPTWVEISLVAGTVAGAVLAFMLFLKVFPAMELEVVRRRSS